VDRTRILLADEDDEYGWRVQALLRRLPNVETLRQARTASQALAAIVSLNPDLVLAASDLPPEGGLELTRAVRSGHPTVAVILLAPREDEEQLFHAVRYGAAAFVVKDMPEDEFRVIVDSVRHGKYVIDDHVLANPALASRVLNAFRELAAVDQYVKPLFAPLTAREIEVLEHAGRGFSNKEIARALSISDQTVKNYLTSIMRKLAVNDRTHAVVYALQHGWISVPEL
jgi:DNA-binding NarL/FixJ family response regulator